MKVSVIIPTCNRAAMVCDCVASVLASDYPDFEVIVVDDCSSDDTGARIASRFGAEPRVRYLRNETNLRTAGARNRGAREARGDWLFFLDNDNIVSPSCLRLLMEGFEIDPSLTLIGALSIQKCNGTIWTLGASFNLLTSCPVNLHEGRRISEIVLEDRLYPTWYVPNAFVVRRSDFERCGGFDASLRMMYEESDFGLRIAGRRSAAIRAAARVDHLGFLDSDSVPRLRRLGIGFPERAFCFARNQSVFVKRHFPFWGKVSVLLVFVPLFAVYYCGIALRHRRPDIAWAFLKGSFRGWFTGAEVGRQGGVAKRMTFVQAVSKIRAWGWSGISAFLQRRMNYARHARRLRVLIRKAEGTTPVPGVTVIGILSDRVSISKTLRDFILSLRDAGIPCQSYDISIRRDVPEQDLAGLITPLDEFNIRRYTHVAVMFHSPVDTVLPSDLTLLRIVFHETAHGLEEASPYLWDGRSLIVGMSDFNCDYYRRIFPRQAVAKIVYPLRPVSNLRTPRQELRRRMGIAADDFVVFFNFDFGSYYRKNALGVLRAFALAFGDDQSVRLVFKTKGAKANPKEARELAKAAADLGLEHRFLHVSAYLPRADVDGLTAASDVYLSLHRGEGFGLGMAEAMAQGIPVVATDWSANTEFCTSETAFPVPCRIVPIKPHEYMAEMREWADADIAAAAEVLRRIRADPEAAKRTAARGRAFLAEHFSLANFRRSVERVLGLAGDGLAGAESDHQEQGRVE